MHSKHAAEAPVGARRYPPSFFLAVAANFFFFASFQWTYATVPGYLQSIGGSLVDVGLATALFSLSAVLARPAIGWLVDRWGRRPMLIGGAALFALAPGLYAALAGVPSFMIVRLAHGVGIAAFTTAYTALVVDLVPAERRGEAIGLAGITGNLGLLFVPALGLSTAQHWGYAAHFLVAAAMGTASLALTLSLPARRAGERGTASVPRWEVARRRPVWVAALASTGLAVFYGAALSFVAPLAGERSLTAAGLYFSASAVAVMLAQGAAGWLSDRTGRRAVVAPGLAVAAAAAVALAEVESNAALIAAGAALGLAWGLARAGLDAAVVDAVGHEARGTALGFLYTCFDAGIGAGSFGLGLAAEAWGYAAAFNLAAAWAAAALALYLVLGRPGPARQGRPAPG